MILVVSTGKDQSVKQVLEKLHDNEVKFTHIVDTSEVEIVSNYLDGTNSKFLLRIDGMIIDINQITAVWYRGGSIKLKNHFYDESAINNRYTFENSIKYYLSAYSTSKRENLVKLLNEKFVLGRHLLGRFNKPIALRIAQECGFRIPTTLITSIKSELISFLNRFDKVITKSMDLNYSYFDPNEQKRYYSYTSIITVHDLNLIPNTFPLTMFQEYIQKEFELRVFNLCNQNYSAAIFSQTNSKTLIDYRRYDETRMNRTIPYKLPKEIHDKVNSFMKKAELNTGSVDLIKSVDDEFVFLEVNPIGQFGYISTVCNYSLEAEISKILCGHEQ